MVKNTKTWISWERNIIFLRNKKILNLCLRWHILRSYRFVAEVTFKSDIFLAADFFEFSRHNNSNKNFLQKKLLFIYIAEIKLRNNKNIKIFRSSSPEVFLWKNVLRIHSNVTGEHPCWSVISINVLMNSSILKFYEIVINYQWR